MSVSALAKKMHLKPGSRARLVNPPDGYGDILTPLPDNVKVVDGKAKDLDWTLLFVHDSKELKRHAAGVVKALKPDGVLWVAYPKKSSKITTDLTRDHGWATMDELNLEGCSLVAVDADWAAMRYRPKAAAASKNNKAEPGMSDEAVKDKTGKAWDEWFAILDREGAKELNHREIAEHLHTKHGLPGWWAQMVTVGYERARGRRAVNERTDGYQVSRSKTMAASAKKAFAAWQEDKQRQRWLRDQDIVIHKATPHKSMRITWSDGRKVVDVAFYPKGDDRCQVVVQHQKLPDEKTAERMKTYWEEALERLKEMLEK
jgi:hypothetical protein